MSWRCSIRSLLAAIMPSSVNCRKGFFRGSRACCCGQGRHVCSIWLWCWWMTMALNTNVPLRCCPAPGRS
ncbi:MAG: hypothetical protein JSW37_12360 [Anaerolineales bacterium]|nr:MAG: hypothetical protein JSW37_12360 [Anaerolineales bacterium]